MKVSKNIENLMLQILPGVGPKTVSAYLASLGKTEGAKIYLLQSIVPLVP